MSLNCEVFFKRTGRIESIQLKSEIFSVPYCNQVKEVTQYRKKRNEKESYLDGRETVQSKKERLEIRENKRGFIKGVSRKSTCHVLLLRALE